MDSFVEVFSIAETSNHQAVCLRNEEYLGRFSESDQNLILNNIFTLAQSQLAYESENAPRKEWVSISPRTDHQKLVLSISLLLDSEYNFRMITYFGRKVDPTTPLSKGLYHALQVLVTVGSSVIDD